MATKKELACTDGSTRSIIDYETIYGQRECNGGEATLNGVACEKIRVKAMAANGAPVFIGQTGLLPTSGYALSAGEEVLLDDYFAENELKVYGDQGDRVCYVLYY